MSKINEITAQISSLDQNLMKRIQGKLDNLTKPLGSLGRIEELARQIAVISGKENPKINNKVIFTFAGDHGVTEEKISPFPQEVTAQMVYNFLNGGAGINVLAKHIGAKVVVADLGVASDLKPDPGLIIKKVGYGTKNIVTGPAMTRDEAIRAIEAGIEIFEESYKQGLDIAGTGDMGIGNTTPSSAITACITKTPVEDITGRGAGLDDQGLQNKIRVIKKALELNKPNPQDALDVLAKVGGFEIGGLVGIILAAAANKTPVVIDGFISGAAALLAYQLEPKTKEYMIASHCSVEKGHKIILEHIGLRPLFNLDMRLGEGTGATLGMNLAEASIKILTEMATFESARVSNKEQT